MSEICENCKPLFEELKKENEELKRRIEKLEKFLHAYENAHTPPSRRFFKPLAQNNNKQRGRPEGHEGTTRAYKKPDRTLEKKKKKCPNCNRKLKFLFNESLTIEEIPEPQPVIVTEFIINHYECKEHGEIVVKHEECPDSGRFGNNLLAQSAIMRFEERLPLRKIHDAFERQHHLDISPASIMNFTGRVSKALEAEYEGILAKIMNSKSVYVDETSLRIDGKNFWIWTFTTDDEKFYVIRDSRGKKVVKEILGNYKGVVVRDGWKAYNNFGIATQRCWAHIKREAEQISDHCNEAKEFYENLMSLFTNTKIKLLKVKNKPLLKRRSEDRLSELLDNNNSCMKTMKIMQKIRNGFGDWFTFVIHNVDPTNNRAEQSLREFVVIRKIIGGLRSLSGAKIYEIVMSCFATWKKNNLNILDMLLICLRN